jgi:hypothetical protein
MRESLRQYAAVATRCGHSIRAHWGRSILPVAGLPSNYQGPPPMLPAVRGDHGTRFPPWHRSSLTCLARGSMSGCSPAGPYSQVSV